MNELLNIQSQYLGNLEFDLRNYNSDAQNRIFGYLPEANEDIYVISEELVKVVSESFENYRQSARSRDVNKDKDYQQHEALRNRLLVHVQQKKLILIQASKKSHHTTS